MPDETAISVMRGLAIAAAMFAFGGGAFSALLGSKSLAVKRAAIVSLLASLGAAGLWTKAASGEVSISAVFMLLDHTAIARFWVIHLGVAAGLAAVAIADAKRRAAILWLAALNLASFSTLGHAIAAAGPERYLRIILHSLHLLGAGFWLGAIPPLIKSLASRNERRADAVRLFSKFATIAVALFIVAGAANLYFIIGRGAGEIGPAYVRALAIKFALVAFAFTLAAINRFYLTPRQRFGAVSCAAGAEVLFLSAAAAVGVKLAMSPPFQ